MGWNVVNMALVGGLGACSIGWMGQKLRLPPFAGAFLAAWISIELSTLATCLELAAAGASPLKISLAGMLPAQGLVGLGEGLATAAALGILQQRRQRTPLSWREAIPGWLVIGLLLLLLLGGLV